MQPQDLAATRHHAQHDLTLIAGFAADDLTSAERARAQALLDSCTDCSTVRDDLVAIARAARDLPAARAPRDFRLTNEQAARLRRTGWLATLLAPFASARSAAKPVATALTTLGLAGVFVATVLPGMFGAAALSARPEAAGAGGNVTVAGPTTAGAASQAPLPQFGPAAASGAPGEQQGGSKDTAAASPATASPATASPASGSGAPAYSQAGGLGRDAGTGAGSNGVERLDSTASPTSVLLLGSLALLAAGLALFGLRFAGRRLR